MLAMELRPAHFPGRAPVDAYGDGGFRFADMSHKGSMLFLPSGIYAWNIEAGDAFAPASYDTVIREADQIEVLLIGTGLDLKPIPSELRGLFRDKAISADSMSTGAAVRTFNVLLAEGRAVAAAFLAV
ncbi:MAG: hypothetical protein KDJ67_02410 [Nitratireductor sp.]|nr:hypothetical protein [Nitratireductor sp.]